MSDNEISVSIEDASKGRFTGLNSLETLRLGNNPISGITAKSFVGLKSLARLDLSSSEIVTINQAAFTDLEKLTVMNLNSSSMLCDCKLAWFPQWVQDKDLDVEATCSHPPSMYNTSVTDISPEEFTCRKLINKMPC